MRGQHPELHAINLRMTSCYEKSILRLHTQEKEKQHSCSKLNLNKALRCIMKIRGVQTRDCDLLRENFQISGELCWHMLKKRAKSKNDPGLRTR